VILTVVLACIYVCLNIIVSSDSMERTLYKASNSSLSIVRKAEQSIFELNKFDELKQNIIASPVCCEIDLADGFCNNKCKHCFFVNIV